MKKSRCKFGIDTCDGRDGTSLFICRDCAEDALWDEEAKLRGEGRPACELVEEDLKSRKPEEAKGEKP